MKDNNNLISNSDDRRQHLSFIQNVITRMSGNSLALKGLCITLVTLVATIMSTKNSSNAKSFILQTAIVCVSVLIFWCLDSFYLAQERRYRDMYKSVSSKNNNEINYSMNANPYYSPTNSVLHCMFTISTFPFYISVLAIALGVLYV